MGTLDGCVPVIESENEYDERGEDFDDKEDAGVVCSVIVVEGYLAELANGIAEKPNRVGDGGGEPEVST